MRLVMTSPLHFSGSVDHAGVIFDSSQNGHFKDVDREDRSSLLLIRNTNLFFIRLCVVLLTLTVEWLG